MLERDPFELGAGLSLQRSSVRSETKEASFTDIRLRVMPAAYGQVPGVLMTLDGLRTRLQRDNLGADFDTDSRGFRASTAVLRDCHFVLKITWHP